MFSISGISDSRTPLRGQVYHKGADLASSLQAGEFVEVEILEILGERLAVLDIRGSAVLAEIPEALAPGTIVRTRVEEVSPKLILVLLGSGSKSSGPVEALLRTHLPEKVPLVELIPQLVQDLPGLRRVAPDLAEPLRAALDHAILSSTTVGDPAYLKKWLEISGLLLESRLARALQGAQQLDLQFDLKALLLRLAERLKGDAIGGGKDDNPAVSLLNNLRTYIKNIELDQFRNVKALADGRSVYLQIPWGAEGERAELFFRRWGEGQEGNRSKGEDGFRVCFLLSLQGLGDLRIDANLQGKRVGLRFEVADRDSAELLKRHFPRLRERLESLDFQVVKVDCVEVSETPRADENDEVLDFGLRDRRLIDVKA